MAAKSTIEWTEASWNPIRGVKGTWHCTHVSEGCRNCYSERMNVRLGGPAFKPGADEFRLDGKILRDPLRFGKRAAGRLLDGKEHNAYPSQTR